MSVRERERDGTDMREKSKISEGQEIVSFRTGGRIRWKEHALF